MTVATEQTVKNQAVVSRWWISLIFSAAILFLGFGLWPSSAYFFRKEVYDWQEASSFSLILLLIGLFFLCSGWHIYGELTFTPTGSKKPNILVPSIGFVFGLIATLSISGAYFKSGIVQNVHLACSLNIVIPLVLSILILYVLDSIVVLVSDYATFFGTICAAIIGSCLPIAFAFSLFACFVSIIVYLIVAALIIVFFAILGSEKQNS